MKPVIKLYAGLITACCMLFAGSLYAAKAPTVDICHWDDDTGEFLLKKINGNAQKGHLGHGDEIPGADPDSTSTPLNADCELVVGAPAVLARAYINVDQLPEYDDEFDIPIVEIIDNDESNDVSVGDIVRYGQYPTLYGYMCPPHDSTCFAIDSFGLVDESVSFIFLSTATQFGLATSGGTSVSLNKSAGRERVGVGIRQNGNFEVSIEDYISGAQSFQHDSIFFDNSVLINNPIPQDTVDNAYLNVEL